MSEIHVLVVDDEKEIADLVEIYLVSDGYKVYKASNALEGLEILEKEDDSSGASRYHDAGDGWSGDVPQDPGDEQYPDHHAERALSGSG